MDGLVLELQKDAMDSSVPLTDLLRKALVVAKKLGIKEFEAWVQCELNGYKDDDKIPNYREVTGVIRAWNPYHGWIPVVIRNEKMVNALRKRTLHNSISDLQNLAQNAKDGDFLMYYPPIVENILMKDGMFQPVLHAGVNSVFGILDATRNIVLEWALKLEKEGILGEGLSFSAKEKEKAQGNPNINIQNFQGVLGDVSNSNVTQNLEMIIEIGNFDSLAEFLRYKELDQEDISELKKAIEDDPKPQSPNNFGAKVSDWMGKMISKAASGVWQIGVSAAGTLLTKAICKYYGFEN